MFPFGMLIDAHHELGLPTSPTRPGNHRRSFSLIHNLLAPLIPPSFSFDSFSVGPDYRRILHLAYRAVDVFHANTG
jgi:hypothetical protein